MLLCVVDWLWDESKANNTKKRDLLKSKIVVNSNLNTSNALEDNIHT